VLSIELVDAVSNKAISFGSRVTHGDKVLINIKAENKGIQIKFNL
jgi:hypothetical protein